MDNLLIIDLVNNSNAKLYCAYVLHYTNYSPTRKDPLKREVRISNSKKQIVELLNQFIKKNIKKGWNKVK